ncbi:MAG: helix-turn-helix transcriptional regulator [Maricaulaceae bacterium]
MSNIGYDQANSVLEPFEIPRGGDWTQKNPLDSSLLVSKKILNAQTSRQLACALRDFLDSLADRLELAHYTFGAVIANAQTRRFQPSSFPILSTYPAKFIEELFLDTNIPRDVVMRHYSTFNQKILWTGVSSARYPLFSEKQKSFLQVRADYGAISIVSLPCFISVGGCEFVLYGLTLGSGKNQTEFQSVIAQYSTELLNLVGLISCEVTKKILPPDGETLTQTGKAQRPVRLSDRERDVLRATALGKRSKEIAFDLKLSEGTVHFHLKNARKRLGANTLPHAIALATRSGLLR